MVNSNSKPNNENSCLKCSKDKRAIDQQAVEFKLRQAAKSIEMALEVLSKEPRSMDIFIYINCANSYLYEASDKAGKQRPNSFHL